jgi:hypothetical protein
MLAELVSTTVEVKHGDSQPTTDHHYFSSSPPTPNPKQRHFAHNNKARYVPPPQLVEGKGRHPQPTASQDTNRHSPIPPATAKKSWYVLALRCTIKRHRCRDDVVAAAAAAAAAGHDGQWWERAKPDTNICVAPILRQSHSAHCVIYFSLFK